MTHEDKIIEQIGMATYNSLSFEPNETYKAKLMGILTTYRTQVLEEKWGELQRHTIKEPAQNMTDWIDWNDVCKVFNKETALELRIKEKEEELALLKAKLHPTN